MNSLLRFLNGYLIVEISGDDREKIINSANIFGVSFFNIKFLNNCVYAYMKIGDFKNLRAIKRKKNVKIRIFKKCGLPFIFKKYKLRAGFFTGTVLFFAVIYFLSGFIWEIHFCGNKKISDKRLNEICSQIGIKTGQRYKKIDFNKKAQELLLNEDGLSWASMNIEGCVLTVNVSEIKNKQEDQKPSNIKSLSDGKIVKIDISSGMPLVKVGDSVAKDELIVSGIIESSSKTAFVKSKGTVLAKTVRTVSSSGKYKETLLTENGKKERRTVLTFFKFNLPLFCGNPTDKFRTETKIKKLKLFGGETPVFLTEKTYYLNKKNTVVKSKEKLLSELNQKNREMINKLCVESAEIIDMNTKYEENGITVTYVLECVENIAVFEPINVEYKN